MNKISRESIRPDVKNEIRVIKDLELREPAINLGLEEAILEIVVDRKYPPTVRFWRNRRAAIIGRSQEAETELDLKNCNKADIPVVRRPTGGGAVLHHPGNLNYSLYLPEPSSESVEDESTRMSKPVASALSRFGLDIIVKPNGLFLDSTKIGGIAQSRRQGLLHHGTILVKQDGIMKEMPSFLRAGREGYRESVSRVGSEPASVSHLDTEVRGRVVLPGLVEVIIDELAVAMDRQPIIGTISGEEWRIAGYLARTKYSSPDWNFRFNGNVDRRQSLNVTGNGGAG